MIVLIGVLSILNLPISQYPDISPPTVNISTIYNGADAQTVEQTITTPIETQVNGYPGNGIYAEQQYLERAEYDHRSTYNVGADVTQVHWMFKIGLALRLLPCPLMLKNLGIVTRKRNPSILMLVAIYSPNGTSCSYFLDNYTNIFVKNAICSG